MSLHVAQGECVALVGESGAGKTTLLRTFNPMVVPTSGEVLIGAADVARQPAVELRRRIGYVPQHGGLLPHCTVLRNAALVPDLLGQRDVTGTARHALEQQCAIEHRAPTSRVFPFTYRAARKAWMRICTAAGIYGATIHDARHTYAVHAVQSGIPEARLQKLLGHAHPGTTRRYAMHAPEQFLDDDATRIAEHMARSSAPSKLELMA